jgi:hypothetical protein
MGLGSGSELRDPEKTIPDPESRGQKGSGSRIRNTALVYILLLASVIIV